MDWKWNFAPILAIFQFQFFYENWNFELLKNYEKIFDKNLFYVFWFGESKYEVIFHSKNFLNFKKDFDYFQACKEYVRETEKYRGKTDVIIEIHGSKNLKRKLYQKSFDSFWGGEIFDFQRKSETEIWLR